MNNIRPYVGMLFAVCFVSTFSQILLKKASLKTYPSFIRRYLNVYVVMAYGFYVVILLVNSFILKYIPLAIVTVISETFGAVLSLLAGIFVFGEKIGFRELLGGMLIVLGIFIIIL